MAATTCEPDYLDVADSWLDRHGLKVLVAFALAVGFMFGANLRPVPCRDTATNLLPGASASCPVGGYLADVKPTGGLALVSCRCRPEPRTYAPESRP